MIWGRYKGIAAMTLGAVSFATMAALVKVACQDMPSFEVVFFRGLIGFSAVSAWELSRHGRLRAGVDKRRLFFRSLFGFLGLIAYMWAIKYIGLAEAGALNQSSPVFVAVLSVIILRERAPAAVFLFVLTAFVGAVLIVSPDFSRVDWDALIGATSGLTAALAYILVRQLRQTDEPMVIVRWFAGWSALLALPLSIAWGWVWPDTTQLLALLGVGVFGLIGQMMMTFAYRWERAAVVSPFLYVATAGSLFYGWLIWDEFPSTAALIGVGLVVGSSLLIGWLSTRSR